MAKNNSEPKNAEIFAEIIAVFEQRTKGVPWLNVQKIMQERAPEFGGNRVAFWWLQLRATSKERYSYIIANLYNYIVHDVPYCDAETDKYLLSTYDAYLSYREEQA